MKNAFNLIVIVLSLAVSFAFYYLVMGNPDNFDDPAVKHLPKTGNVLGMVYTGGPLVSFLIAFVLIATTFIIERAFSIVKAKGRGKMEVFIKNVQSALAKGDIDAALKSCDQQRGSLANIIRAGLEKYQVVENEDHMDPEKKMLEVKRAIDEATNLETPLLEKNLVILSTVASIATMVGLLGTTLGMIKAFAAVAKGGTVSATQLSLGISEALYNTAGGLVGAVISIVAYNYFTTKVDDFVYMIDEAILNVTEILTVKVKK